ncbi:hypothetical protein AMECASPLE_008911 [Ameca splendens]|uniref:Uncharacterized protein n=1 Tax=Ameca splendens TaxID=208324 RepID=A0ABV0Z8W7_9TELE
MGCTPFEASLGYQPPLLPADNEEATVLSVQHHIRRCKCMSSSTTRALQRSAAVNKHLWCLVLLLDHTLIRDFLSSQRAQHGPPVTSFLTRCRRSPAIWRLTGAAYLVISHGAIRLRTASTSAADCFAPCGLALCIVTLVSKNLWKVPRTVNLTGHLTLAGSPTRSEYRFSCEPCPPSSKDYLWS